MSTMSRPTSSIPSLEAEATTASERLRAALADVITALPGPIRKAADLQRCLGVDSALAWNLHRAALSASPLEVGRCVPGERAMERFLRQAEARGVPADLIDEVRTAFSLFEEMVARHAGDRDVYESIVVGLQGSTSDQFDLKQKRAAFRANRHIWGWEARVLTGCSIIHPAAQPGFIEHAFISGEVDLRHLREGRVLRSTMRAHVEHSERRGEYPEVARPIDPDDPRSDVGLFSRFCSQPIPDFQWSRGPDGTDTSVLTSTALGNLGAVTYFKGVRFAGMKADPPGAETFDFKTWGARPMEVLIQDILLHEKVWRGDQPTVQVFTREPRPGEADDQVDMLPIQERVLSLGSDLSRLRTPDMPQYLDLLRFAIGKLGWDERGFHIYRLRVEYPVLHACVRIRFGQPAR